MYSTHILVMWLCAVVFTILTFYKREVLLFGLLASAHWFFMAYSVQDIDFVFGDGINTLQWTADINDFGGMVFMPYFFSGIGVVMSIVTLYHLLLISKQGVEKATTGGAFNNDNL